MTLNQYIKLFTDISTAHRQTKYFGFGPLHEYLDSNVNTELGAHLWLEIENTDISGGVITDKFTLYCMDYVNKDATNRNDVLSDTKRILEDVIALLHNPVYYDLFELQESTQLNVFYDEKLANEACGWHCIISLKNDFTYDSCQIPLEGIPVGEGGYVVPTSWSPEVNWGDITGTLSNQTDLQAALDAKVPISRTLTINGTTYDLSANRSWTIAAVDETLAQTLGFGEETQGHNMLFNNDDQLRFGDVRNVAMEYHSVLSQFHITNSVSVQQIKFKDAGGLEFSWTTASKVLVTDASNNIITSSVGTTQLSYISGLTSDAQTQLNAKQDTLVSGTNLKTVGGVSLLGSGDIGSISTTYTDAKIKGSATSGKVLYASATDTAATATNFSWDNTNTALIVGGTARIASENFSVQNNANGTVESLVYNPNAGTSAFAQIRAYNGSQSMAMGINGSGVTGGGLFGTASMVYYGTSGAAGTAVYASNASGTISFYTGGSAAANLRGYFLSGGQFNVGTYGTPSAQRLMTVGDTSAWVSIGSITTSSTSVGFYANQTTPSGSNYSFNLTSTNTNINASTAVMLQAAAATRYQITTNTHVSTVAATTGSTLNYSWTAANSTTVTASTAVSKFLFTQGSAQWATGALAATQKFYNVTQPSMSFVAASTATLAGSVVITGAVDASTNATITTSCGLLIESAAVNSAGTVTTSYGAYINAMTGGGTNYALGVNGVSNFLGNVRLTQTVTTEAVTSDTTVTIVINGTTYKLLAKA